MIQLYAPSGQRVMTVRGHYVRSPSGSIVARLNGDMIEDAQGKTIAYVTENQVRDPSGNIVVTLRGDEAQDVTGTAIARVTGEDTHTRAFAAGVYYYFGSEREYSAGEDAADES